MISRDEKIKLKFFFIIINLLFFFLFIRLIYIYVSHDKNIERNIEKKYTQRVSILDRNGEILATNLVTYSLYAVKNEIRNEEKIISDLQQIFAQNEVSNIQKRLKKHHSNLLSRILLIRDLTPKQKQEIDILGHVGLYFHEDYKRFYPHKNVISHLIGFVDKDEKGLAGFEKYIDSTKNKKNKLMVNNNEIKLSIDIKIQYIAHKKLTDTIKKFSAKGGAVIVIDVNNGEIISLVSLPDYDPYNPSETIYNRKYNNKASFELYEMGSTFKTFTFALALEENMLDLKQKLDVSQNIKISGFTIKDFKKINDKITIKQVFTKSSNIGTAKIAQDFSEKMQQRFFAKLGLFSPLEIELVEKRYSTMPKRWGIARKITTSYGYGITVSAIHLSQALSAIVNGGNKISSTIVKQNKEYIKGERIISEKTSEEMRKLLAAVVTEGTATRAKSKLYNLGGKTGSANKVGKYGYDETRLLSSFFAAFPIEKPKYLVYVFLDEPKGTKETRGYATGGVVAAPIVKDIVENIGSLLKVEPIKYNNQSHH